MIHTCGGEEGLTGEPTTDPDEQAEALEPKIADAREGSDAPLPGSNTV